jgi:hypothetical protein
MFVSLNVLGSLVLDVNGNRLDATFIESTGAVRDTFTIRGGSCAEAASVLVSRTATVEVGATTSLTATPGARGRSHRRVRGELVVERSLVARCRVSGW